MRTAAERCVIRALSGDSLHVRRGRRTAAPAQRRDPGPDRSTCSPIGAGFALPAHRRMISGRAGWWPARFRGAPAAHRRRRMA